MIMWSFANNGIHYLQGDLFLNSTRSYNVLPYIKPKLASLKFAVHSGLWAYTLKTVSSALSRPWVWKYGYYVPEAFSSPDQTSPLPHKYGFKLLWSDGQQSYFFAFCESMKSILHKQYYSPWFSHVKLRGHVTIKQISSNPAIPHLIHNSADRFETSRPTLLFTNQSNTIELSGLLY